VNAAAGRTVLSCDYEGNVEAIGYPKTELKKAFPEFDEIEHGRQVVPKLDLDHVLSNPSTCAYLRSLFAWCVRQLTEHCPVYDPNLTSRCGLPGGVQAPLTAVQ
jgi:hypothetical protein